MNQNKDIYWVRFFLVLIDIYAVVVILCTWLAVACSSKLLNSLTFFCSFSCQAKDAHNKAKDLPEPIN